MENMMTIIIQSTYEWDSYKTRSRIEARLDCFLMKTCPCSSAWTHFIFKRQDALFFLKTLPVVVESVDV